MLPGGHPARSTFPLEPGPLEPGPLEPGPLEPGPLEPGPLEPLGPTSSGCRISATCYWKPHVSFQWQAGTAGNRLPLAEAAAWRP
jgi:hypothetical protein